MVRLPWGLADGQEHPVVFPGPGIYHLVVDKAYHNPGGPSMAGFGSRPFRVDDKPFPLEIRENSEGQSLTLKVPDRVLD